jgi:hypothetical protein
VQVTEVAVPVTVITPVRITSATLLPVATVQLDVAANMFATLAVTPFALGVTTYPVIAEPPFVVGAVQEIVTFELPEIAAVTPVGAVVGEESAATLRLLDARLEPTAFAAFNETL